MGNFISNTWDDISGQTAAEDVKEATAISAQYQQDALDYLRETEAMPQAFREGALTQLGAYYGIGIDHETGGFTQVTPTGPSQAEMIQQAQNSPLYAAMMGGRDAGEEALARRSAASGGGLRGGATTSSLINYNTDLANSALLQSYGQQQQQQQQTLAGLGQLASLPSNANQIAQATSGIGQTYAQGQVAAANAKQAGLGAILGIGGQLGAAALANRGGGGGGATI